MIGSNLGVARNLFDAYSPQSETGDGTVDGADYVLWRSSFGATEPPSAAGGGVGVAECDEYIKASTPPPSVIDADADHLIAPIELNGTGDFLF